MNTKASGAFLVDLLRQFLASLIANHMPFFCSIRNQRKHLISLHVINQCKNRETLCDK